MFKKVLALLLVFLMTFALAACGEDDSGSSAYSEDPEQIVADVSDDQATASEQQGDKKGNTNKGQKDKGNKTQGGNNQQGNKTGGNTTGKNPGRTVGNVTQRKGNTKGTTNASGKNITAAIKGLSVKKGASLTEGLNLKGKTITMAITEEGQYNTQSFKRTVAAFEKQYNCKVQIKSLDFGRYNQQVAQRKATGSSYDICYIHGSMYPSCAIDNLYEDLTSKIRTGDLMDDDSPEKGGIDLNKTSYFASYQNKIYGTCNFQSVFPYVIYYNKCQIKEKGLNDPRALDEKGKWTWAVIQSYGKKLTDSSTGKYCLSNSFTSRGMQLAFGAATVKINPKKVAATGSIYSENVTSKAFIEAWKFVQKLSYGSNAICEPSDQSHPYNSSDTMLKGSATMWTEETSKYLDISKQVKTSTAFQKSKSNIGIASLPMGKTNKNRYPTGWLTAVACGKGKNPLVSIAWDVFRSSYEDPIVDQNQMSRTDQKYCLNFMKGDICCEVGEFFDSADHDVTSYFTMGNNGVSVRSKAINGGDVAEVIASIKDQINAAIKFTMKK